jgi:hypothetical protein
MVLQRRIERSWTLDSAAVEGATDPVKLNPLLEPHHVEVIDHPKYGIPADARSF